MLIRNFKLFAAGQPRLDELETLPTRTALSHRAVADNLADIAAQVAANRQGARDLQTIGRALLAGRSSKRYMGHIQDAAERKMRQALRKLADGRYRFADHGRAARRISRHNHASKRWIPHVFDFTGTGPVVPGNLNAKPAIVTAAVMYCLRCLIDEEIPLNQGVLAPVAHRAARVPVESARHDDPAECAAVVGGNVETSQRVVDVLLGALRLAAASQGTMNNLLFGDETFGYYETICGGCGATPTAAGADAVHSHMTNTRLTDPEVLERRYPVRVREFSIRPGSGGAGQHRGGDGVVRRIEFLKDLEVSVVSQRRGNYAPYGLHGGGSGTTGRNLLLRADGSVETLPGLVQFRAKRGDQLLIETPGGGGWGA